MFTGPYGVSEDGTYSEWVAVRKQSLCLIPDGIDDVNAAGIPVAYLTAQMALSLAGFQVVVPNDRAMQTQPVKNEFPVCERYIGSTGKDSWMAG
jgi:NADPH:quinone reductase-like Zn-dependent oxidoreductase